MLLSCANCTNLLANIFVSSGKSVRIGLLLFVPCAFADVCICHGQGLSSVLLVSTSVCVCVRAR